jgi:hypothetical protein
MAYDPSERMDRMKELMKPIDSQIMLCDDKQDLLALASIMAITAKNILVQHIGEDGARAVLSHLVKDE